LIELIKIRVNKTTNAITELTKQLSFLRLFYLA
jgi:hypothetical protein